MGHVATSSWSVADMELLSRTLKAIAHPSRIAILEMLEREGKMTVTDIYTRLNSDQSSVSHHLSILRSRGIVGQDRQGRYIYYFLDTKAYVSLFNCLTDIQSPSPAYY